MFTVKGTVHPKIVIVNHNWRLKSEDCPKETHLKNKKTIQFLSRQNLHDSVNVNLFKTFYFKHIQ